MLHAMQVVCFILTSPLIILIPALLYRKFQNENKDDSYCCVFCDYIAPWFVIIGSMFLTAFLSIYALYILPALLIIAVLALLVVATAKLIDKLSVDNIKKWLREKL